LKNFNSHIISINNKFILSLIIVIFFHISVFTQTVFYNNGTPVFVDNNATLFIDGDYQNEYNASSSTNGLIDLDGRMIVNYNWINNALNNVFINVEPIPDGIVDLSGSAATQLIQGFPTHFENLRINNITDKRLEVSDCEVNGILTVDAVLDLNTNKIIIDNPNPNAITYVSKYILSETVTALGYGEVQWNIQDATDTYEVPFGSGTSLNNDLNLTLITKSQGQPNSGNITFATYPTDIYNSPLPTGASPLTNPIEKVVDRFWIIDANYLTLKPTVDIIFKYTDMDIDPTFNFYINPTKLQAIRNNTNIGVWDDWGPKGLSNEFYNTVAVEGDNITTFFGVAPDDFFENWTLVSPEVPIADILIPNAFTPDGDGINDTYIPKPHPDFVIESYEFYIFNRWGEVVFKTNDINQGWDGRVNNGDKIAQMGVYNWIINIKGVNTILKKYKGHVVLVL